MSSKKVLAPKSQLIYDFCDKEGCSCPRPSFQCEDVKNLPVVGFEHGKSRGMFMILPFEEHMLIFRQPL
jgi:hypothetical protein